MIRAFVGRIAVATRQADQRTRLERVVFGAVSVAILVVPVLNLIAVLPHSTYWGFDYRFFVDAAARWTTGGTFYPPYQLTGPFGETLMYVLYPPTTLLLLVPFIYLPAVLWWAIPAGIFIWQLIQLRPRPLVWPFLAICLAWPGTPLTIYVGNPAMWFAAALAAGTLWAWPSVLIFLKPQLAVFALWGIHRRSWWLGLAVLAALSLLFLPLWPDWIVSVQNSRIGGVFHSVQQIPLFLWPVIVWIGRSRSEGEPIFGEGPRRVASLLVRVRPSSRPS